jgi:hypothetical protein
MKDIHTLPPIAWDDFRRKQSTELVTSHKEQIMLQIECPNLIALEGQISEDHGEWMTSSGARPMQTA